MGGRIIETERVSSGVGVGGDKATWESREATFKTTTNDLAPVTSDLRTHKPKNRNY